MKETVICVLMRGPKVMVQKEGTAMKLPQFEVDSVDEATVVGGLAKMGLQTKGNHIRMLAKFQQDKKHATHLCIGFCQNEHKEWEKVYPAKIVQSIEQLGDKQFEGTNQLLLAVLKLASIMIKATQKQQKQTKSDQRNIFAAFEYVNISQAHQAAD